MHLISRMPVILEPDQEQDWLLQDSLEPVISMLKAYPEQKMTAYPISTLVNSPVNNSKEIIDPI